MKTVIGNVFDALEADATLSAYVERFYKGSFGAAEMEFPFVNVGEISYTNEPLTVGKRGRDNRKFTLKIQCGTSHIDGDIAYYGTDAGKGILSLCDDIVSVCIYNTFSGAFNDSFPCAIMGVETVSGVLNEDMIWIAEITLQGSRLVVRT